MHDLRWDQEAEDAATHARLKATVRVRVLTPEQLRTVEMPNLRSPEARSLDGETRDLRPYAERNDERLARIEEAIERIADKVTVLMLEREAGGGGALSGSVLVPACAPAENIHISVPTTITHTDGPVVVVDAHGNVLQAPRRMNGYE